MSLTCQELSVLRQVATGATNDTIATNLGIATQTVKFHITNTLRKLDASTRSEAVWRSLALGIISPPDSEPRHRELVRCPFCKRRFDYDGPA